MYQSCMRMVGDGVLLVGVARTAEAINAVGLVLTCIKVFMLDA